MESCCRYLSKGCLPAPRRLIKHGAARCKAISLAGSTPAPLRQINTLATARTTCAIIFPCTNSSPKTLAITETAMKHIATKIDVKTTWDQLSLPQNQHQQLLQIVDEVAKQRRSSKPKRRRDRLNQEPGVVALFSGSSGTGKTMAAEVLANELRLDLYELTCQQ